ncbi:nucleoside-diphosphate sugar epimerase [Paenibacillus protaetiae]|uniref:Nucleoside-diphosphate sugar epimerase n=1 Tax=Paenibacillus protaetiae TaxID=2509456 RepID=A0A4P6EVN0_9BACL|nr:nucleoside-diphosphate sugar epimerase [Paenibacillus protaetiae]QAY66605.1 nucleoside-diphosphate sugar epimerase [Paenibacillus protaetiae]
MQQQVTELIEHMSHSHLQLARMLEAERDVVIRMAEIVLDLPDEGPDLGEDGLMDSAQMLTQSVVSYLASMAELQETLAVHMQYLMKEMKPAGEDDEE